jgi:asparagine synthase (glutamine-hydrolysing)
MCGIAGLIRLDGQKVDQSHLDRLTDALSHRGPDGRGTYIHDNVGLGHRRLRIIDLSEAAAQPMKTDDEMMTITFNGEIYNFAALRLQLEAKGYAFTSTGDTEVLLKLYQEYGPACVSMLRGQFAFAIHDRKRKTVFLARDRVGKKPIKYFHRDGVFAFASELKALRTLPECPREFDREAIHHYLTLMYLPVPLTGFVGLLKLPAAHTLTIDLATGEEKLERYWELNYEPDTKPTVLEWQERIRAMFNESVKLRMVADVPVGAFLSGGVDSGAVVAAMSKLSTQPVKTFSIGSTSQVRNELPLAAMVAERYHTDHHPIVLEPDIVHLLPELVEQYEEPYADPSSIPTYLVARETRKDVTVALNGDGGDENFAGYIRYPILQFSEKWAHQPAFLRAMVKGGASMLHSVMDTTLSYRGKRFASTLNLPWPQRYLQYLSFFTEEEKTSIYADAVSFKRTDAWYSELTKEARGRGRDTVHKALSMDIDTYLADDLLPKVDLGTMAHGLEARSPFLDHELLELTAKIPIEHKLHGKVGKWILKDMLKDDLPADILWRKKSGFRLPLDQWFRGDLKQFVHSQIMDAPPAFWEMFDRAKIEKFLNRYHDSRVDYSDHVWALLWLSEWMRRYTA